MYNFLSLKHHPGRGLESKTTISQLHHYMFPHIKFKAVAYSNENTIHALASSKATSSYFEEQVRNLYIFHFVCLL